MRTRTCTVQLPIMRMRTRVARPSASGVCPIHIHRCMCQPLLFSCEEMGEHIHNNNNTTKTGCHRVQIHSVYRPGLGGPSLCLLHLLVARRKPMLASTAHTRVPEMATVQVTASLVPLEAIQLLCWWTS